MNEDFVTAKKGEFWEFPIITGIDYEGGKEFFKEHCHNGLAMAGREGEIAAFGGWHKSQAPQLVGTVNWEKGSLYFKSDTTEFFVLKSKLILN